MTRFLVGTSEIKLTAGQPPRRQYRRGGIGEVTGLRVLTFFFPDEAALVARFRANGFPAPAFRSGAGGRRTALVTDPDGQWVELAVIPNAPPQQLAQIEAGLTVSDLEKSRAFYREFVGLEELPPVADPVLGVTKYGYRHGTTTINLWTFGGGRPADTGSAGIQYVVSHVDAVDAAARARGVAVETPLANTMPGLRTVWLNDPDGVTNYFAETTQSGRARQPAAAIAPAGAQSASAPGSGIDRSGFSPSVRPQDDFFEHVNGAWVAAAAIPPDKRAYGTFIILRDRSQREVRSILEEASAGATRPRDTQQIGDLYASFLDEARANSRALEPIRPELAAIDAVRTRQDLVRHFARLARLGVRVPIVPYVGPDAERPDVYALGVRQGGLGLPNRDYYLEETDKFREYRRAYVEFLRTTLGAAGERDAAAAADAVIRLETEIATQHWTAVQSRDRLKMYHPVESPVLAAQFPGMEWDVWLSALDTPLPTRVIVNHDTYVSALARLVAARPVDDWKPYLKVALVDRFSPYLHAPLVEAEFAFRGRALNGLESDQPRWARGVDLVNATLGEAVGKAYVARHFRPDAKAQVEALIENLRTAFRESLDRLDWMTPATRAAAQAKLAKFRAQIGYSSKWREYDVTIRRDDLAGNVRGIAEAEWLYQVRRVGRPADRDEWTTTPQTVNAFYNPRRNSITFPAAILQPPFFDAAADPAVNYGAIGSVIGHEMGHGFDDQGRRSDGDGVQRDWWTPADAAAYEQRGPRSWRSSMPTRRCRGSR